MNRFLLAFVNLLPDFLLIRFVRYYVHTQMKKHAVLDVTGLANLNSDLKRPYLFVCNHLSNADGLVLNKVLENENPIFLAGRKLEANSFTHLGFKLVRSIPILPNSPDKEAIKKVIRAVKDGNSILLFPEGTRSRTARMLEGKKGIVLFAKLTHAPIVPIGMWGTEKFMPVKEDMTKEAFHDAVIHVNIGEAFILPDKREDETKGSWEERCLNQVMMSIAALLPKEYRGFYDENG